MNVFSKTIDSAKGFAIILVVLGHINSPVGTLIFSFHIPLFFFLAGIFIKTSYPDAAYLVKSIDRLMIPFLLFGALGLLAETIKNLLLNRPFESIEQSLSGLLYWMDAPHMHHYGFVLWFLPALFWGRAIVFFAVKHIRWRPEILAAASVLVAWLAAKYATLPFGLDKSLVALPWIMMGYVFYQYHERWLSSGWYWSIALGFFIILLVYSGGMQRLDLATKNVGNLSFSIPYTLSLIFLLIGLLYRCSGFSVNPATGLLIQFGQHSMLVMILHVYTNNVSDIIVNHILGSGYWFVTFFMSMVIVYTAIQIKRRYADFFVFKYL